MSITLLDGVTVEVKIDPTVQVTPTVTLPFPSIEVVPVVGLQGPAGPKGNDAQMIGPRGHIQYTGDGPPGVIVGAQPGATYLDRQTGTIYSLE